MSPIRLPALGAVLVVGATLLPLAQTQAPQQGCCDQAYPAGEWQVSDAEKAIAFYHGVLGLDLPAGWTGKINPPSPANGPLTGAVGGRWRVVGLPIPGARWSLQLVETTGLDRQPFAPRRQDVGATGLILYVRDLDVTLRALRQARAPIVTTGGAPVAIGPGRSRAIVAADPDGFFVEVRQADPARSGTAPSSSNVVGAGVSTSVADTEATTRFWRDVLGFDVRSEAVDSDRMQQALHGTPGAGIRKSVATIPPGGKFDYPGAQADLAFEFLEFSRIDRRSIRPRYQDPGVGGFVFRLKTGDSEVRGREMTDFVRLLKSSGTPVLTVGGDALDQGRRFAIFFQDLNGLILEATQSTPAPGAIR